MKRIDTLPGSQAVLRAILTLGAGCRSLSGLLRAVVGRQDGQAMVEYSTISIFMLVGVGGAGLVEFLPKFLNALNIYLNSYYFMLNAALG